MEQTPSAHCVQQTPSAHCVQQTPSAGPRSKYAREQAGMLKKQGTREQEPSHPSRTNKTGAKVN
jgi:hypothetical protein